ncbi:MAG: TonB-dependent receptor [Reichenbachiella sp.]
MRRVLIFVLSLIAATTAFGQSGYLRGKIIDAGNGEGLLGATIAQQGTTNGSSADFDGNYSLTLPEGTYTIEYRFFSYETKVVTDIQIVADEVTSLDVALGEATTELEEIVVTAEQIRDNEVALLNVQRKSANTLDGISAQSFKKIGDSNLAGAIKRVTGVAIQEGKYVYVRGLGDRYTKTTMNGMNLPGLDPDRNDVQIDIFPTSVLENVMVYKTFTPDIAGDFTGGTVNVETKSFPEEKSTSISFGIGFNPDMHFNNDYVTQDGSSTDFLGFDDGQRKLPFDPQTEIPDVSLNDPELESLTRSFNPQMAAQTAKSFMNTKFSINHGNQVEKGNVDIGYGAIFNYQNNVEYYDDAGFGIYTKDPDKSVNELFTQQTRIGQLGSNNVMWSLLLNGAVKFDIHEFNVSLLRTQNGISQTTRRVTRDVEETGQTLNDDILTYTQRSVTNFMIGGKHNLENIDIKWTNSLTFTRTYDPDFRVTNIAEIENPSSEDDYRYSISSGDGGGVRRFYRDLNELNENFKVDVTYPFGEKSKLKAGANILFKDRTFDLFNYFIRRGSENNVENDADWFLESNNVWSPNTNPNGTFVAGGYEAANNYEAQSTVFAGYAMADMSVTENLRAIYGVRLEKADMYYTGHDAARGIIYNNEHTLDELNILPSVNLVYSVTENMNFRASYGRTLARPSFKEKSIAQILDPISGLLFNGNLELEQTNINNYDFRFENFFGGGDMVSVSGFYKTFDGHIEMVTYDTERTNITPRNLGASNVYGVELEVRKALFSGISVGTNVSLAKSAVDTRTVVVNDNLGTTEYESRVNNARDGEEIDTHRPMAGQSPYLVNGYVSYGDSENKMNISLAYNVQGESISVVGIGATPDVFVKPFHSLNFNAYRNFGPGDKSRITVGLNNILDSEKEYVYKNNGAEATYSIFSPGRTLNVKYSLTF